MVTHGGACNLMGLIKDLSYIYERCRATTLYPNQYTQVKGKNLILEALKRHLPLLECLADTYSDLNQVSSSAKEWVIYLDKKYPEQPQGIFGRATMNLSIEDAKKLQEESNQWINRIIDEYAKDRTVFIRNEIFPDSLLQHLDELTREDLKDALNCIFNLLPTPAAMIAFRATEHIVRQYYTKITKKSARGKSWKTILDELERNQQTNMSLINYLDYLRDKRNEAEHPDKRFTQEESERVLLHIKGLLEELKKV